jgi:class 3 adenylate cyclase/GAF domain-containing protein
MQIETTDMNGGGVRKRLEHKLHLAFVLIFLVPFAGLVFFGLQYPVLSAGYVPYFILGFLAVSLAGFSILSRLFRRISALSAAVASDLPAAMGTASAAGGPDELGFIGDRIRSMQAQFDSTALRLAKKTSEIALLKDLSDLCYVTFDPEEILFVALERALQLSDSDLGSVLALDKADPRSFIVKATIGLDALIAPGDRIDFDSSIAKYAVINKIPLLVADIEKDKRFGRANMAHYGSKSFICMPIKTSKDVIGVITLTSRDPGRVYTAQDVEALSPLLSNAAFTYENIRLLRENEHFQRHLRAIEKVAGMLTAGFGDAEMLQAVLQEIHSLLPLESAAVFVKSASRTAAVQLKDLQHSGASALVKGAHYECEGSLVEKVITHEAAMLLDAGATVTELDRLLLCGDAAGVCQLLPLKAERSVFGVLALTGRQRAPLLEVQDLLRWIGSGLALAMDRNRLLCAVVKRDQELETIRQVGSVLASSTFDIGKVLSTTLDMISEVMNVEAGSLLFADGQKLEVAAAFDGDKRSPRRTSLPAGRDIADYVAARGEAVIVNDTEKPPHLLPAIEACYGAQVRSALCVPMVSQGRVIGVIEVLNKVNGRFDANDRDLLQAIAASVCIALENARLYKQTVQAAEHERDVRQLFQKFVPKEVVDKIIHGGEHGRPGIEELKTITLLNVDIRGFSNLARRIGPRRTVFLLNRFFGVMGEIVFSHRGIVDKYLGDGFLSLFGAPVSDENDAENAVAAAVAMRAALGAVNRQLEAELGLAVEMGISIHTGEVVVGNIGFEKKMDYTVIGDSVNTVFRLQALAHDRPNGILISESALNATGSRRPVQPVAIPPDLRRELGDLNVFALMP